MPNADKSKEQQTKPVFVVCGQEEFLKRQAISEITDRVLGPADRSLAINEYDGSSAAAVPADVLDDLRTLPFMTKKRLVILNEADAFITRYREDLEKYLTNPCPTGVLLLLCGSFPGTTRLYKRVKAIGEVIKCEAVPARQISGWLSTRCRNAYNTQIEPKAATMLREMIGDGLGRLDCELRKLSLYVGERERITTQDVELAVGHCRQEQVWGILSAVAAGNQAEALAQWEEVWQTDRAASARAIGGIAFTVRRLLEAKRAQETGTPMRELARMLWRNEQQARMELAAFTIYQLEEMLCKLSKADVDGKTGLASIRSSIEAFIVEMCNRRRNRRAAG